MASNGEKSNVADKDHLETERLNDFTSDSLDDKFRSMDISPLQHHNFYPNSLNGYHSEKIPEFMSEQFFSTHGSSYSHNEYSPYSLRLSQLSIPYQFDVLLLYDPEDHPSYLENLMEYLAPQDLKIYDFNRDAPPGLPAQKVLQNSLRLCRYTCIMITQRFISNFWLQFRTDMSIQDMLDNQEKLYSVIVVVMDCNVKRTDLPLDLATLSPLFITDRFFVDRIKRAFSKTMPFPPSVPASSSFSKQGISSRRQPPRYSDIAREVHLASSKAKSDTKDKYFHTTSNRHHTPSVHRNSKPQTFQDTNIKSVVHSATAKGSSHSTSEPTSHLPTEHSDHTYLFPHSMFPSTSIEVSHQLSIGHSIQRASSVTISSTGSRQPQEGVESGSAKNKVNSQEPVQSLTGMQFSSGGDSSTSSSGRDGSVKNVESSASSTYVEEDFSFLNQSNSSSNGSQNGNLHAERGFESPGFFSIQSTDIVESNISEYSDLEISEASLPYANVSEFTRYESMQTPYQSKIDYGRSACNHPALCIGEDVYCQSLRNPNLANSLHEMDESLPRCNSLGQDKVIPPIKKLSHTKYDASCSSLPEHINNTNSKHNAPKRSWSMRSLVSVRLSKMSKTLRGKKK